MPIQGLLQRWRRREKILAEKLNRPVDDLNQEKQVRSAPANLGANSKLRAIRTELIEEFDEYLTCYLYQADVRTNVFVKVAKPYLLRHIEVRNGITYTYTGINQRDADNGSSTITEQITPDYVPGDEIWIRPISPYPDIVDDDNVPLRYIDLNMDGRAWAEVQA